MRWKPRINIKRIKMSEWKNKLYCGDNLKVLSTLDNESIDLIYIDPPFFSGKKSCTKIKFKKTALETEGLAVP